MRKLFVAAILTGLLALPLPAAVYYGPSPDIEDMTRTSGYPNEDNVSVTAWVYIVSYRNESGSGKDAFFALADSAASQIWEVYYAGGSARFGVMNNNGSNTGSLAVSTATWYFLAFRRSGTNHNLYVNGSTTADVTNSTGELAGAASRFTFAAVRGTGGAAHHCDCRIAAIKAWNAYLTPEEFQNEMRTYRPKKTTSLYAWVPNFLYTSPQVDISGTAHDFTYTGTPTTADGPPISW